MEFIMNIIFRIVAYIFGGAMFIGLIVWIYDMIRWAIYVSNHDFDPFKGWWD